MDVCIVLSKSIQNKNHILTGPLKKKLNIFGKKVLTNGWKGVDIRNKITSGTNIINRGN